jgi:hypothetical protein
LGIALYSKNPRPKARRLILVLILTANGERFEYDNEQPQAHRQLRKHWMRHIICPLQLDHGESLITPARGREWALPAKTGTASDH